MFRPPYDDSFKVSALEMLSAAGYPAPPRSGVQRGALIGVSRALGVPTATLRRWALAMPGETPSLAQSNGSGPLSALTPPAPLSPYRGEGGESYPVSPRPFRGEGSGVREKAPPAPLPDAIRAELLATLASMAAARSDATYKELGVNFAMLVDKLRQLEPAPEGQADSSPGEYKERMARLIGVADPQGDS